MSKKHLGMALVALGVFRYYVENVNPTSSIATNQIASILDYGGGPGSSTITYGVIAVGAFIWYKHK